MNLINNLTAISTLAYAADENPFKKLGDKMKFDFSILDGLDWLVLIFMIVLSLAVLFLMGWIVWDIIKFLIDVRKAKADFKNKKFYIELIGTVIFIFLLVSGTLFDIFANIYDWTSGLNIGESTNATP